MSFHAADDLELQAKLERERNQTKIVKEDYSLITEKRKWYELGSPRAKQCPHYWDKIENKCVHEDGEGHEGIHYFNPIDLVNHPLHYTVGKFEVIDVLEDWNLNYHLSCVVKYIARAKHKGNELQDLKKAQWYLNREISRREVDEP